VITRSGATVQTRTRAIVIATAIVSVNLKSSFGDRMHDGEISIWLFIGVALVVNGALIFSAGIYELLSPPAAEVRVVLYSLHAPIWWGAMLFVLGGFYCRRFWPGRTRGPR
jgi:hypothetical protein